MQSTSVGQQSKYFYTTLELIVTKSIDTRQTAKQVVGQMVELEHLAAKLLNFEKSSLNMTQQRNNPPASKLDGLSNVINFIQK